MSGDVSLGLAKSGVVGTWFRSGLPDLSIEVQVPSPSPRPWLEVHGSHGLVPVGGQAASVVVTVRVWSAKLATSSRRPPRAWT